MEKNKKVMKKYVMIFGGSRGELDDVVVVEGELSIREYLKGVGDKEIESLIESCIDEEEVEGMRDYIDEMGIGFVEKYDSSKGFEVYVMIVGGSGGELDDVVVVVEGELSIKEYLKGVGDKEIESLIESCIDEEEVEGMRIYIVTGKQIGRAHV